jgi:RimJ/RimL family protein N-acetyltransferase
MQEIGPVTLAGQHVRLAPLSPEHHDGLVAAAQDGELWRLWYTAIPSPAGMADDIARRLALQAAGSMVPFTVFDAAGTVVGMTTYMHVDAVHRRVEIGSAWYARRVQRTSLNTKAKLLLLGHAFENLACLAVEFRTHVMNQQSRHAIARRGAKLDGILRCHQRASDGSLRDTCVDSVTAAEWPAVRSPLRWQLARRGKRSVEPFQAENRQFHGSPLPNDQSSRWTKTRLIMTSSGRTPSLLFSSPAIYR